MCFIFINFRRFKKENIDDIKNETSTEIDFCILCIRNVQQKKKDMHLRIFSHHFFFLFNKRQGDRNG
jgi:hypothetical protein